MTSPVFNVVIIGAGEIGAFYDYPGSANILTHAHAFKKHKGFNLIGFVDSDKKKSALAARKWGVQSFNSIRHAFKNNHVDIACITVPDQYHYNVLKEVSKYPVKFVFTEKPLSTNMKHADEIIKIYKKKNIPVAVNYRRCYVPEFQILQNKIKNRFFGDLIGGTGYYGKGLLHNGSHMINLLQFLIGEVKDFTYLNKLNDFKKKDPLVSAILFFQKHKQVVLNIIDSNFYTIFELDLLFEKGRLRITETGFKIEEYQIKKDKKFKGFEFLVKNKEYETFLGKSLYFSSDNIYQFLTNGESLKCSIQHGYETLKVCSDIISEMNKIEK